MQEKSILTIKLEEVTRLQNLRQTDTVQGNEQCANYKSLSREVMALCMVPDHNQIHLLPRICKSLVQTLSSSTCITILLKIKHILFHFFIFSDFPRGGNTYQDLTLAAFLGKTPLRNMVLFECFLADANKLLAKRVRQLPA